MLLKIGAVLAAIPLALGAAVGATGVVIVDVKESGPNGHRIVLPVPLLLAETAVRFAPIGKGPRLSDMGEAARYLPVAEGVLAALADSPDAELVRVDDRDEHVRIAKVGKMLEITVDSSREKVRVNVPLSAASEVLRQARGGSIDPGGMIGALRQARFTDVVEVENGDEHVKISVW
jgi:hypothetical protein